VSCPSLASLKPTACRNMCGWIINGSFAALPVRCTMRRNHAAVTGVPCSVVNTYGLAPPWRGRKARNSGPRRGWRDSIPPFSRFTCNRPCFRSTSDQRSWQSSEALSPCRYARRIAATSLAPFLPRLRGRLKELGNLPFGQVLTGPILGISFTT
jgi:hypothetical protein